MKSNEFCYKSEKKQIREEKNTYQKVPEIDASSVTCSNFCCQFLSLIRTYLLFSLSFLLIVHDLYPIFSKSYSNHLEKKVCKVRRIERPSQVPCKFFTWFHQSLMIVVENKNRNVYIQVHYSARWVTSFGSHDSWYRVKRFIEVLD